MSTPISTSELGISFASPEDKEYKQYRGQTVKKAIDTLIDSKNHLVLSINKFSSSSNDTVAVDVKAVTDVKAGVEAVSLAADEKAVADVKAGVEAVCEGMGREEDHGVAESSQEDEELANKYEVYDAAVAFYIAYGSLVYTMNFFHNQSNDPTTDDWSGTMEKIREEFVSISSKVVSTLGFDIIPVKSTGDLIQSVSDAEKNLSEMINKMGKDKDDMYEQVRHGSSIMKPIDEIKEELQNCVDEYRSKVDEAIHYLTNMIENENNNAIRDSMREDITNITCVYEKNILLIQQYQSDINIINPSRFLLEQYKLELRNFSRRNAFPMKLHEALRSPLSTGILEYHEDGDGNTLIKLVNKDEIQKLYDLLRAFDLVGINTAGTWRTIREKMRRWGFIRVTKNNSTYVLYKHSEFDKNDPLKCRVMLFQRGNNETKNTCGYNNCTRRCVQITIDEIDGISRYTSDGDSSTIPFSRCNSHIADDPNIDRLRNDIPEEYMTRAEEKIYELKNNNKVPLALSGREFLVSCIILSLTISIIYNPYTLTQKSSSHICQTSSTENVRISSRTQKN